MKILNSLVLSFCLLFAFGVVLAQENVTAQDLNVSEPTLLPDSPFYFFKTLGREIQSAITLNPLKKAELREKFANEKLLELRKVAEKTENPEKIKKATENYQKEVENVKEVVDKIKETAEESTQVGQFLDKFIRQQTLHQTILQKLVTQVPQKALEKITEAREAHLEKFGEVMTKLEEKNKEKIQERLEKNLEKLSTSTKETIIKVRDRAIEKIQQKTFPGTTTAACITSWNPVCGKDGKTYSNSCFAKSAGVEIDYESACKPLETGNSNKIKERIKSLIPKLTP